MGAITVPISSYMPYYANMLNRQYGYDFSYGVVYVYTFYTTYL